jgi:hypothetical protein
MMSMPIDPSRHFQTPFGKIPTSRILWKGLKSQARDQGRHRSSGIELRLIHRRSSTSRRPKRFAKAKPQFQIGCEAVKQKMGTAAFWLTGRRVGQLF